MSALTKMGCWLCIACGALHHQGVSSLPSPALPRVHPRDFPASHAVIHKGSRSTFTTSILPPRNKQPELRAACFHPCSLQAKPRSFTRHRAEGRATKGSRDFWFFRGKKDNPTLAQCITHPSTPAPCHPLVQLRLLSGLCTGAQLSHVLAHGRSCPEERCEV